MRYKILAAMLTLSLAASLIWILHHWHTHESPSRIHIHSDVQHAETIKEILAPLRYSGLYDFIHPDAYLFLDFQNRKWHFRNIHQFDENQELLLHKNRFGLCGDLSVYVYQRIRPLFDSSRYEISFVRVGESGYFHQEFGSHYILMIQDQTLPLVHRDRIFFIDPSLRRYGRRDFFDQYVMLQKIPADEYIRSLETFNIFELDRGPPILITPQFMLSFNVTGVDGKFDPDHYRVNLYAAKRYGYLRPILFTIEKQGGKVRALEKNNPFKETIPRKIYEPFIEQLKRHFDQIQYH